MIIGVRHGERANRSKIQSEIDKIEKSYDVHLTDKGSEQGSTSGKVLKELIGDKKAIIICSPFLRTIQTAVQAAQHLNVYKNTIYLQNEVGEILIEEDFECNPFPNIHLNTGGFSKIKEYIDFEDKGFSLETNGFIQDERLIQPILPEDMELCNKRLEAFYPVLIEKYRNEFDPKEFVICIFSHQGPLRSIRFIVNNGNEDNLPFYDYCGIMCIEFEDLKNNPNNYKLTMDGGSDHITHLL